MSQEHVVTVQGPGMKFEKAVDAGFADAVVAFVLSSSKAPGERPGASHQVDPPRHSRPVRRSGQYDLTILGQQYTEATLKACLKAALVALHRRDPDFLLRLSKEVVKNRRVVARRPEDLFISSPHLAADYAEPLPDGWYFDTNLSSTQVRLRLELACKAAGITFGVDLVPPKQLHGGVLTSEDLF